MNRPNDAGGCVANCLVCGKCASQRFYILDGFEKSAFKLTPRPGFGVACDIGTTSIVLALLDLATGEVLARHGFYNPQRCFGADVITRVNAANSGKLEDLRRAVVEAAAAGIEALLASRGVSAGQVADITIAANTVMTYLLLGLPCQSLGTAPFKPEHELSGSYSYKEIFGGGIDCPVRITPWLAAFVGGDVTAGLLYALNMGKSKFMLIDLGTNGEMALCNGASLTVTSTAAGPAFEGKSRAGGASGVLNELAALVRGGHIDETGRLSSSAPPTLTQGEIRDLQLAKSAVRSGLEILLEESGLSYSELDAVYLAGGIGQAMDAGSAAAVGLLPAALAHKATAIGNASLGGAVYQLLAPEPTERANALRAAAVEINLSAHRRFNDCFMEYMGF